MRATSFVKHSLAAVIASFALSGASASAAPLPSSTVVVKTATPTEVTPVGYLYRDEDGALINGRLAVGFVDAVSPFYAPSYYPAYVYSAPPAYYAPLPYEGPAIVYGRPLLAADPYYPAFYPYVRGPGYFGRWRHYRH
jgi:hypothetical protein